MEEAEDGEDGEAGGKMSKGGDLKLGLGGGDKRHCCFDFGCLCSVCLRWLSFLTFFDG